ncbi:restriction endonuclease subunit S [Mycoplasma sp. 46852]|uniref:restriction endonuclease subunit S n=1 Tax=Mycoplasma sp. 46852 TaxID=3401683 RepID=UPI003AABFB9E
MQKDKLVPDIRFKGFEEEWKTNRLCEVALKFDNLRIPVSESLRIKGPYPYYGANGVQDYVSGFTHNGEFVLIAEDGANDLDSYPSNYVNGKFWANNHVHVLQGFKDTLDNKFLNYSFTNVNFKPLLTGGDRAKLTASALDTINIKVPIFNEQRKIGSLLNNIDQSLLSQKSKLEKLQIIKQSLLSKMFASDNQKMPDIRFKDFLDAWNHKLVKSLGYITTGNSNTQDSDVNGAYPFFIRSDKPLKSNKYLYDEEAVITIGDGNIGKVFHYINGKFDLHQRCYKISNFTDVLGKYFYWYFSSNFYDRVIRMSAKATVDSVRLEMIADMEIYFPSNKNEQSKISIFLDSLDSLIHSQEQKLEKLNNIKQALLEKMFC